MDLYDLVNIACGLLMLICHFDIVLWITWQEIASFPYNSRVLVISKKKY